ncbi:MAG: hypothetical protein ACLP41_17215 [Acidimicrobiales bacterium]
MMMVGAMMPMVRRIGAVAAVGRMNFYSIIFLLSIVLPATGAQYAQSPGAQSQRICL